MNKKTTLRVCFVDYWDGFPAQNNEIINILSQKYNVVFDNTAPDIMFYSSFGWEHLFHNDPLKVFWTDENEFPDFNECDYAISHLRDSVSGRNFWHPWCIRAWCMRAGGVKPLSCEKPEKRPFASFIASHANWIGAKYRVEFTRYIMEKYRHVDCPGKMLHNIDVPELAPRHGAWQASKHSYIGRYKFNIAFENSNTDGYITEKLTDCFVANTVPIYWGSEGNIAPFPKEAVILANDYPDFDSLIARIKEVDENDELYLSMLNANPMRNPEFMAELQRHHDRLRNFVYNFAQEALRRKEANGRHNVRSVGNFSNLVDFIVDKKKLTKDEITKETQKLITDQSKAISEIGKSVKDIKNICGNIDAVQDKLKWEMLVLRLPSFKRRLFWVRIMSHILPRYHGGAFVKEKRELRQLITEIKDYCK